MPATVTADLPSVDIRTIHSQLPETGDSLELTRSSPMASSRPLFIHRTSEDQLELEYQPVDRPSRTWHTETLDLDLTPCYLGGTRPWFICPGDSTACLRRVAILYERNGLFRCRRCHDLRYPSQYQDALTRAGLRLNRITATLTGTASESPSLYLPDRPPRMHTATYARHLFAFSTAFDRYARAFDEALPAV